MRALKTIAGICCFILAASLGHLTEYIWLAGPFLLACVIAVIAFAVVIAGGFLIKNRRNVLSTKSKCVCISILGFVAVGLLTLDGYIRYERSQLQHRTKDFLSRPVPEMFRTNEIGGYQAGTGRTVLSVSHALIERYAKKGRIYPSASLQASFAVQPFETLFCEDAAKTNAQAKVYIEECKAIIEDEWRMGLWQSIEDTIEMRFPIPEIKEQDRK